MIVILVLGVLSIMLVMVLDLAADATLAQQLLIRAQQSDQAYQLASSAAVRALEVFRNQDPKQSSLLDAWAVDPPPLHLDGYVIETHLTDEESLFNPNRLIDKNGAVDDSRVQALRRMLRLLEQREDWSNALLDWIDADSERREPMGGESLDYKNRHAKNALLDSPEEIAQIMGTTPEMLSGSRRGDRELPPLTRLLTVHSAGFVNVNTADPWVLRALAPGFNDNVVSAIVDARRIKPFTSVDDMFGVPGVTRDDLFYVKKLADVKSATWRVEVTVAPESERSPGGVGTGRASGTRAAEASRRGDDSEVRLRLTAVYRRTSKGFTPLLWNVGEVSAPDEGPSLGTRSASDDQRAGSRASAPPTPSPSATPKSTEQGSSSLGSSSRH